jgi:hypothetical protein
MSAIKRAIAEAKAEDEKWKAIEARRKALDELFLNRYPHLRPTPERLAALKDGKCAHCSARYPEMEHVAHYYCSHRCALAAEAAEDLASQSK